MHRSVRPPIRGPGDHGIPGVPRFLGVPGVASETAPEPLPEGHPGPPGRERHRGTVSRPGPSAPRSPPRPAEVLGTAQRPALHAWPRPGLERQCPWVRSASARRGVPPWSLRDHMAIPIVDVQGSGVGSPRARSCSAPSGIARGPGEKARWPWTWTEIHAWARGPVVEGPGPGRSNPPRWVYALADARDRPVDQRLCDIGADGESGQVDFWPRAAALVPSLSGDPRRDGSMAQVEPVSEQRRDR